MTSIMLLHEGVCPQCSAKVDFTYFGGTNWFFEHYGQVEVGQSAVVERWSEGRDEFKLDFSTIKTEGEIEFVCENGHEFTISVNSNGDWNE